jgi:hypothetical protein
MINRIKIPIIDKFKCDGKRNICGSINIYNEKECLPIALESMKDFPLVFVSDGKWQRFKDTKCKNGLSYDGSRDIAQSFPNVVLIDVPNCTEEAQSNTCCRAAALYGYDFLFQLAADEYIKDLDYNILQKNCYETKREYPNNKYFYVRFEIVHITPETQRYTEVARIVSDPMFVRGRNIHWIYYFNNMRTDIQKIIKGITIHHDDRPRNQAREKQMKVYQEWNVPREADILKSMKPEEMRAYTDGLVKMWVQMDFPPTITSNGNMYWTCGCIKISGIFTKRCIRHERTDAPYAGTKNLYYNCGCIVKPNGSYHQCCADHLNTPATHLINNPHL